MLPGGAPELRWPDGGPRVVWRRPLGEGYSAISVVGETLVTMYRQNDAEIVVALDAETGRTRWEHRDAAPWLERMDVSQGPGPHATPLVHAGRVYAAGATGRLRALDARTGAHLWTRRLLEDLDGTVVTRGYASSPLAFGDLVIVQTGGEGHALTAFDQEGRVVWRGGTFHNAYSSPILARVDGEPQVIALGSGEIVAVDARTGVERWRHPHPHRFGENIPTPIWRDGRLFTISYADGGSRMLAVERQGNAFQTRELWHHTRLRVYYTTAVWLDDVIIGSSGDAGPTVLTAVDAGSGDVLWQLRDVTRASIVGGPGRRLLLRDDEGRLVLAQASREGLTVEGRAEILGAGPPTPPTVRGTRVFVRDRREVMALDLR
jgi:outer membrane protein assembly factor BamB